MSRTPTLLVYTAFPFPAAVRSPSGASPAPPTVRTGPSPRGPTRPSCRPPLRGAYKSRHQTGAALFSPHVLPRPVGSHRIPTNRATGTHGRPSAEEPGLLPIHSSGRVVRQLVFSPVVSSDLGLSVSPSLCLSPACGRASPHPPPLSFLFQERDLHGVLDGRTDRSPTLLPCGGRAVGPAVPRRIC